VPPAKQGAAFGHTKIASKSLTVRGLNALAATVCTPIAAPVITTTRMRGGNAACTRGAAWLVAEAINTARSANVTGLIVVRADSAFYNGAFIWACRRNGAHFSVTARMTPPIRRAITGIDEGAWTAIEYPNAVYDEQTGDWISDAEIAEVPYTAFASTPAHRTEGRLIVRRVRERNRTAHDQGELFAAYRYHAVFTDSPFQLVQAESQHRARHHRTGLRRPARRTPGAPALGKIQCQRRLVAAGRERARIHPRAGRPGLTPACAGPRRHYPHSTDQRRRPPGPPRTRQYHLAPATALALETALAQRLSRHPPCTTGISSLTASPRSDISIPTRTPTKALPRPGRSW
jgi:hypothetical protein